MENAPNEFEQLMLEYTNRARMNPDGEYDVAMDAISSNAGIASAVSYFGVDMDVFATQMAAYDPVAPLAWNDALAIAADGHSQLMIEEDEQSHRIEGEASLLDRVEDAGYDNLWTVRENVYAYTKDALYGHVGFMVDWGYDDADFGSDGNLYDNWQSIGDGIQDSAGHQASIMSGTVEDIGISALEETDPSTGVGPWVVTQDFAASFGSSAVYLLGVFIDDADDDAFYDIGEGIGDVTVTVTDDDTGDVFATTTWAAGGYQVEVEAGSYTVEFSSDDLPGVATYSVDVANENTKLDGFFDDLVTTAYAFADGFEAKYFSSVSEQVFRLYQAVLGREPDSSGHLAWTERLAVEGRELLDVIGGFMGSNEYQTQYGGLENEAFVELLYSNVLGRDADDAGLTRWVGELESGTERASVIQGFSESTEFKNSTADAATAFTKANSPSEWSDDVFRLYQATLDRAPDATGFVNWSDRLGSGTEYLDAASGFVNSTEFKNTYQDLSDSEFVTLLYANVLDRAPDETGLANWSQRMADGMTEVEVVQGFAQSAEFISATAESLKDWIVAQGVDDELEAGSDGTVLAGGSLSDSFVFSESVAESSVLDLEAWDFIDLTDFDLASVAEAQGLFSQQGDDVVFDDNANAMVTFVGTDISLITDDMILI
ncbi:DUF4214 domain-containing protein [Octadecabacter sp. CECT 8868]|uniref:DUF4214 domain-containing protein n=1 Tax=Octadecabacter algicola TaxID=2909342 RepID=UPI001F36E890|nr:DUF4214 domain-containing protein [Octadecabacter algicola]MCF2903367.1 DUF4214 domain-containing protein [Octadecabacter algicola]